VEADLPVTIALSVLSAAIGKHLVLQAREYEVRGNLFTLASAPSGVGKSSCFRPLVAPLLRIEEALVEAYAARVPQWEAERELLESEAGKLKRAQGEASGKMKRMTEIKARLQALESLSRPPQLIAENVTIEALAVLLACNDETLALLSADGSEVITNWAGRYNKTDRSDEGLLLKAWSLEPCRINRISRPPVLLQCPCLTVLLCCTPDEVRNLFSHERFMLGGLMPRFLVCESRSRPKERNGATEGLNPACWEAWHDLINRLYGAFRDTDGGNAVHLSAGAQQVFDHAHNAYCRSFDQRPEGDAFEARRVEQAMRLALCLHAATHADQACRYPLDAATANTALQLARYYGQAASRQREAAQRAQDEDALRRLAETAASYGTVNGKTSTVTLREVMRRNSLNREQITALVNRNPAHVKLRTIATEGKAGRPSEVIQIRKF
jgi:hypothetical protein